MLLLLPLIEVSTNSYVDDKLQRYKITALSEWSNVVDLLAFL